jgi:hypothetical protein
MLSRRDVTIYGIVHDAVILLHKAGSNSEISKFSKNTAQNAVKKDMFLSFLHSAEAIAALLTV